MTDIATISATIGALKTGIDAARTGVDLVKSLKGKDPAGAQKVVSQLSEELFQARSTMLEVQSQLMELRRDMEEHDQFLQTFAKYRTGELPNGGKVFALREPDPTGTLFEFVCPKCVVASEKFYPLQGLPSSVYWKCPACNATYANVRSKPRAPKAGGFRT